MVVQEMDNQLLGALYNLTRISKARQEQAALAGIIPHLKEFINNNSPLKQFALSCIIDLAHVHNAHAQLWENQGVEFYLRLLKEEYWKVNALDSLSVWYVLRTPMRHGRHNSGSGGGGVALTRGCMV
jgi:hypothetical protein